MDVIQKITALTRETVEELGLVKVNGYADLRRVLTAKAILENYIEWICRLKISEEDAEVLIRTLENSRDSVYRYVERRSAPVR